MHPMHMRLKHILCTCTLCTCSDGGHYAPNVAYRIMEGNKGSSSKINLKGLAIGNGLTDPALQYPMYAHMANNNTYGVKAVSDAEYTQMLAEVPKVFVLLSRTL